MSAPAKFIDVKIMGREYRVACTQEERDALLASVELVDQKMSEIAQRTKNTIAERVAVMAALNIAHELLACRETAAHLSAVETVDSSDAKRRIVAMGAQIDDVLAPQQQLDS